jgi:hypothetical protein
MNLILMLLFLLVLSVIAGVIRVFRGGTFLPEPTHPTEPYFENGRWWRYNPQTKTLDTLR